MTASSPQPMLLLEKFENFVKHQPNKVAFSFLDHEAEITTSFTYMELYSKSITLSKHLSTVLHLKVGDRAMLVFPPSLDFMVTFLACLMCGVIAVPVFPPDPFQAKRDISIFSSIMYSSGANVALTSSQYRRALSMADMKSNVLSTVSGSTSKDPQIQLLSAIKWESVDEIILTAGIVTLGGMRATNGSELAFLQYTSGSTSEPKGVMISHANLSHNLSLIITGLSAVEDTVVVSWLPQYHDMGLIGSYLGILYCGGSGYYISPMTFIKNPVCWIRAISKYQGTHMQAPNFAYSLTAKKFLMAQKKSSSVAANERIDLSSVRHMINAAEPVDRSSIDTFYAVFEPYGLKRGVVYPTYGLAEHTVYVCSNGSQWLTVHKQALEQDKVVIVDGSKETPSVTLAGCGRPIDSKGVTVKIVSVKESVELPEDAVGEIWIDSPSKARGYWSLPEKSVEDFEAKILNDSSGRVYLRTGDLGFLHNNELFICGRLKDLIIIRGKNFYPHDIEKSAENLSFPNNALEIRKGCSAAFGITVLGCEVVLYVAELSDQSMLALESVPLAQQQSLCEQFVAQLRAEIFQLHNVMLGFIGLLLPRKITKTSSGKIARQWVKKAYLEGSMQYMHAWSNMDNITLDDSNQSTQLSPENIAPDVKEADKIDPTGLPISFLIEDLKVIIAKCLEVSSDTVRTDVPISMLGIHSAQGILLQAYLDNRYSIALPDAMLFEIDATITSLAKSFSLGGQFWHRPVMINMLDVFNAEVQRNGADNRDFYIRALSTIVKNITGSRKKKSSNMKTVLSPQWFKEHQLKAHIDTLRFPDGCARVVLPITFSQQLVYFFYALVMYGVFFWVPILIGSLFYCLSLHVATMTTLGILAFVYLPNYEEWPPAFRTHRASGLLARYFSYRTIIEAPTSDYENLPSIYAFGPHGVFGLAPTFQAIMNGLVVGEEMHFLAAPAAFYVPFYNMLLAMMGFKSVDRSTFTKLLKSGRSVGVLPGGIAEMFAISKDEEVLMVQNRKGFIKIALQTGAQIVPCYCFGNTQTFSSGSTQWLASLSRILRMSFIVFWGRFGLPIPHRTPLLTVLGRPISCPKMDKSEPSAEMINEYHELYLRETRRIYDTYKNTYNWETKNLIFRR